MNIKNEILIDSQNNYEEKISKLKNEMNNNIKNLKLCQKISTDEKIKIKKL